MLRAGNILSSSCNGKLEIAPCIQRSDNPCIQVETILTIILHLMKDYKPFSLLYCRYTLSIQRHIGFFFNTQRFQLLNHWFLASHWPGLVWWSAGRDRNITQATLYVTKINTPSKRKNIKGWAGTVSKSDDQNDTLQMDHIDFASHLGSKSFSSEYYEQLNSMVVRLARHSPSLISETP